MRFFLLLLPAALLLAQSPAAKNFKEAGSPNAPITVEIYADFECPHCRALYIEVVPSLMTEFVQKGKVRLIHRDFPLPMHPSARLAARYANAAGQIGRYDVVANQIFLTQPDWSQNGNVDGAVAKVLSPSEMETVRSLVKNDPKLDDTVTRDVAMGTELDHLKATPTIVIVYKGKRDVITGGVAYPILKSYLNAKLAG
jgi:protein-disulfide isomerase